LSVVVEQLSKHYGSIVALDRVDLVIAKGSFTTLLGPSGSGKSTLLMCLAGFSSPTHGRIRLDGRDITSMVPERRNFGVVFQGYALFPHLSIAGNIGFPLLMRGFNRAARSAAVSRMLKLVKLEGLADRKPAELSGGQQQRVALARALSFDPAIVLLDEPLSALDRGLREALRTELRQIHKLTGATFVMVTHDQEEALSLSDQVIVLNHGRVIQQGSPREIYDRPMSRFAAEFVGKTNLIPVTVEDRSFGRLSCRATDGTLFEVVGHEPPPSWELLLSVRPEAMWIAPGEAPGENRLRGRVADSSFEGFDRLIDVDTAVGRQQVRIRSQAELPALGELVTLAWRPEACHLVPRT
jgi:putative spermidine/putrescine transport system ATP-binding protein